MRGRLRVGRDFSGFAILCLLLGDLFFVSAYLRQERQLTQRRREVNSFSPRIIGGNTARNGRYPYAQISLATNTGLHQCGGSLIAPDVILTAGHCHGFFSQIRVNIYNIRSELESYEVFEAKRMHFHPNFDELWFRYDFLLLQLNGTVQSMDPVTLNSNDNVPYSGDPLTVVGWGLTDPDDSSAYPDILREVQVSYVSNEICESTISRGQRLYQGYIFNDMLCAAEPGKDACAGDSGAPLIRAGDEPDKDLQVGVVSWGNGCATEYPGVYSRVSYQFGWIKGLVCEISNDPPNYFGCPADVGANNEQEPVTTPAPVSGARPSSSVVTPSPAPTPAGYLPIRVDVQLDLKSSDTGWALMSEDGEVIAEVEPGQYTNPYELTQTMVYLPPLTQFSFVIKDTAGDGICCQFGGGWYQVAVVLTDGTTSPLVKGYGTFSLSSSSVFETPEDNLSTLQLNEQPNQANGLAPLPGGVDSTFGINPGDSDEMQMGAPSGATITSGRKDIFLSLSTLTTFLSFLILAVWQ